MPAHAPVVTDERSALVAFLHHAQDAFRIAAFGLTDDRAGRRSTASELRVGTIVKHVTSCQESWLLNAQAAPERYADPRPENERMARWMADFQWSQSDTLPSILAAYDEMCERVLEAVSTLDLDTPVPVPEAPWFPKDVEAWSVRWVWFHLLDELARHAGHADIIREGVDGATAIELLAGREGWPETPWVKPWRPAEDVGQPA